MFNQIDIFEKFPSGSFHWRGSGDRRENALVKMQEYASLSRNEFFAICAANDEVIARVCGLVSETASSLGLE